jgi:beta-alanine--pyruvate transaminase
MRRSSNNVKPKGHGRLLRRWGTAGSRAYEVRLDCFDAGLLIRVTVDITALSPPLIVEQHHINAMV